MSVMLLIISYTNYSSCSSLSSSAFTGTSSAASSTTQYNSCTGGSSAEYGDSGSVAVKVNDDPYLIWLSVGGVSILAYTYVAFTSQGKFGDYFYSQIIDASEGPPAENTDAVWTEEQEGAMAGENPEPVLPPAPGPPAPDASNGNGD